jgi:hypothetical protein
MNITRKLELAKAAIDSILTHDDDHAAAVFAGAELQTYITAASEAAVQRVLDKKAAAEAAAEQQLITSADVGDLSAVLGE